MICLHCGKDSEEAPSLARFLDAFGNPVGQPIQTTNVSGETTFSFGNSVPGQATIHGFTINGFAYEPGKVVKFHYEAATGRMTQEDI